MDASLFYSIESFLNFQSNKKPSGGCTRCNKVHYHFAVLQRRAKCSSLGGLRTGESVKACPLCSTKIIGNITKRYFWIDIGESSYERSMVRFRW